MAKFNNYDEYIADAQPFARPILKHLRACMHEACPEVKEEFKWSFPNFTYKKSILTNMAGFKNHVAFGFWLGSLMDDPDNIMTNTGDSGMGHLGNIKSMSDLPHKDILIKYIQHAMQLTDEGKKLPVGQKKPKEDIVVPEILIDALGTNDAAAETFNNFSPSNKHEYVEWITEAKTEKTRLKRLVQTMEWLEEGKPRNWKYIK